MTTTTFFLSPDKLLNIDNFDNVGLPTGAGAQPPRAQIQKLLSYIELQCCLYYRRMAADDATTTKTRQLEYCETCKANKEVINVEMLSDTKKLKTLECGHKLPPQQTIVITENLNISGNASWVILKNP